MIRPGVRAGWTDLGTLNRSDVPALMLGAGILANVADVALLRTR